jgi:prevent-host-death family protein
MREIGVRDLKAQLSSVLREVEGGERVRVTSRGRLVAEIVPVETPEEQWQRLIVEGRITPSSRPKPKGPPPRPRKTGRSGTAIILAEREEER